MNLKAGGQWFVCPYLPPLHRPRQLDGASVLVCTQFLIRDALIICNMCINVLGDGIRSRR